jgi:hypothetical protein
MHLRLAFPPFSVIVIFSGSELLGTEDMVAWAQGEGYGGGEALAGWLLG